MKTCYEEPIGEGSGGGFLGWNRGHGGVGNTVTVMGKQRGLKAIFISHQVQGKLLYIVYQMHRRTPIDCSRVKVGCDGYVQQLSATGLWDAKEGSGKQ